MSTRPTLEHPIRWQSRGLLLIYLGFLLAAFGVLWPVMWFAAFAFWYGWSPVFFLEETGLILAFAVSFLGLLFLGVRGVTRGLRAAPAVNLK